MAGNENSKPTMGNFPKFGSSGAFHFLVPVVVDPSPNGTKLRLNVILQDFNARQFRLALSNAGKSLLSPR